jgi:hypothetical protein
MCFYFNTLIQLQPIVKNRRETVIQFVGKVFDDPTHSHEILGESTCNYPGTLWHKSLNELDCQEEVKKEKNFVKLKIPFSYLPNHFQVFL